MPAHIVVPDEDHGRRPPFSIVKFVKIRRLKPVFMSFHGKGICFRGQK